MKDKLTIIDFFQMVLGTRPTLMWSWVKDLCIFAQWMLVLEKNFSIICPELFYIDTTTECSWMKPDIERNTEKGTSYFNRKISWNVNLLLFISVCLIKTKDAIHIYSSGLLGFCGRFINIYPILMWHDNTLTSVRIRFF